MRLKKLIKGVRVKETIGNVDVEISGIKCDSSNVSDGDLFICIRGECVDGHDYARNAVFYGASAVITERKLDVSVPQIIVEDSRIAMSLIACEFFGNGKRDVKLIGVTGTNGKTTTTHLIKSIFDFAKIKCGLIGTLGAFYGDVMEECNLTTPDPVELHGIISRMRNCGVKVIVMEVSAHALYYDKLKGLKFDVGCFTNLTQDHLDFFVNMDNYKRAKFKFFSDGYCDTGVLNADDAIFLDVQKLCKTSVSYGLENPSDVFAVNVEKTQSGSKFVLNLFDDIFPLQLGLMGDYNVYNALCAITATSVCGVDFDTAVRGLEKAKAVSGRLERITGEGIDVFIDYAHTPDGLEKSLKTLKERYKRVLCVFGCGGNRDKSKRKIMGETSGEIADFTVVTSDNPRYEESLDIISEIEKGVIEKTKSYVAIEDRKEAIEYAIKHAIHGDAILIAGKGSENYQEILGIKHPFNDKDIVEEILRR